MGKFSKPRNADWQQDDLLQPVQVAEAATSNPDLEETQLLPSVEAETQVVTPVAEESEVDISSTEEVPDEITPIYADSDDFFDNPDYDEPKQKKSRFSSKKFKKVLLICLCAVIAVALLGGIGAFVYISAIDPNDGKILNNVSVAGINIGNMTRAEAKAALRAATDNTYTKQPMVVQFPGGQISLMPEDTKASLDVNAVIDAAYDYGRTGTEEERAQAMAASMNAEHPIALLPYMTLDSNYVLEQMEAYADSYNSIYEASSVTFEGELPILDAGDENFNAEAPAQNLIINLGRPGRNVNAKQAYNLVLDAYSFNKFQVDVHTTEPEVLPDPIDLDAIAEAYITEPKDAIINSETYEVVMEVYGYSFDLEYAKMLMETSTYGDILSIPMTMVAPEVTGGYARDTYFRDILGEYQTKHTSSKQRNTNLDLACQAINGTVLSPGEEFDFNTVVGKRTKEKGYQYAPAYSGGLTVDTLGGGICQVSSTIYYCTLLADLEIINRQPHSYVSSYMPMGTDATVSWGGPEFTFKNSTNYPIRIETWVADGYVHCRLVGTDEKDYYIEIESDVLYYTYPENIVEVHPSSSGYYDGQELQSAYRGAGVQTYKLKYDKVTKELISREEDRKSVYKSRNSITVSIKDPEPAPAPAPETSE